MKMVTFKEHFITEVKSDDIKYAFTTAQGSRYIMTHDGKSRRIKSLHANTGEEDQGLHDWNDLMIFTDPSDKQSAGAGQYLIGRKFRVSINLQNNKGVFYVLDKSTNQWREGTFSDAYPTFVKLNPNQGNNPLHFTYVPYPVKGWDALEFKFRPDKTIKGVHFGSPVSQIDKQMTKQHAAEFEIDI